MKRRRPRPVSPRVRAGAGARVSPSRARYPILEFDRARKAVLEPGRIHLRIKIPEHCVFCFFPEFFARLAEQGAEPIYTSHGELGASVVYKMDVGSAELGVLHPGVGGPMAAARLEKMIALGCRKFIACGGAGVLDPSVPVGHIIVPYAAVRDEGTSYHYLPPSREVEASARAVSAIESTLKKNGCDYTVAKTWTTDAVFRETRAKIRRRRAEGCLTVDMEAATFFAVAKFRGVEFGQLLYAGDSVSGPWDHRNWMRHEIRERLFVLAAESCLAL